jgi:glycosyltransferase involved in cell wall biosynthesis
MSLTEPVVTGAVRAGNSADRIGPLLERLSSLVDHVVVLLDSRSNDGTEQIAKSFGTVHHIEFDDHYVESLRSMLRLCTGDWILYVDCDEWLDGDWSREAIRELTADRYATMYWFPRRWVVPPDDRPGLPNGGAARGRQPRGDRRLPAADRRIRRERGVVLAGRRTRIPRDRARPRRMN